MTEASSALPPPVIPAPGTCKTESDPPREAATSAAKAASWTFMAQASIALVNLPVTFMLARALSPSGLGSFQLLSRLALVSISVAHLGYPHGFAWAAGGRTSDRDLGSLVRKALRVGFAQGAVVLGAAVVAGSLGWRPGGAWAWFVIAAYPLLNITTAHVAAIYRGALRITSFAAIRVAQAAAWLLITAYLFASDELTVTAAVGALVASQALALVVAILWSARSLPLAGPQLSAQGARALRQFSLRLFPGLTVREWNLYLDQILVGLFFSSHALGIYAVAVSANVMLAMLATPFINTAQPVVQRAAAGRQFVVAARLVAASVVIVGTAGAALALLAPVVIPFAYGGQYSASVMLVQILCLASVFDAFNATMHGVLLGLAHPADSSRATLYGFAANGLAWCVLLPLLGIRGAAITSVLAYAVVAVAMTRAVARRLRCGQRAFLRASVGEAIHAVQAAPQVANRRVRAALLGGAGPA